MVGDLSQAEPPRQLNPIPTLSLGIGPSPLLTPTNPATHVEWDVPLLLLDLGMDPLDELGHLLEAVDFALPLLHALRQFQHLPTGSGVESRLS